MNIQNVRTYDDNGNMFGAYHVDGIENRDMPDVVIYGWSFIDGVATFVVWAGEESFY